MAVIMDRFTFKIIDASGDTPKYPKDKYLINPDKNVMTAVDKKYWVADDEELREMTQEEKDEYEFSTNSSVFFIDSHSLQTGVDGNIYTEDNNAILNPIIPKGGVEYGIIIDNQLVEMSAGDRLIYDYEHKATIYLIIEKEVLQNVDATLYTADENAMINPEIPPMVELKFTKIVEGIIVEMSEEDKDIIKATEAETKAIEDAVKEAEEFEKDRTINIVDEIALKYSPADEIAFLRKLITGESRLTDVDIMEWLEVVAAAKAKYPKVQL